MNRNSVRIPRRLKASNLRKVADLIRSLQQKSTAFPQQIFIFAFRAIRNALWNLASGCARMKRLLLPFGTGWKISVNPDTSDHTCMLCSQFSYVA